MKCCSHIGCDSSSVISRSKTPAALGSAAYVHIKLHHWLSHKNGLLPCRFESDDLHLYSEFREGCVCGSCKGWTALNSCIDRRQLPAVLSTQVPISPPITQRSCRRCLRLIWEPGIKGEQQRVKFPVIAKKALKHLFHMLQHIFASNLFWGC